MSTSDLRFSFRCATYRVEIEIEQLGASLVTLAVDTSNYQSNLDDSVVSALAVAGVEHAVVAAEFPYAFVKQTQLFQRHAITVDAYIYLYNNDRYITQVESALSTIFLSGLKVNGLWLDLEDETSNEYITPNNSIQELQTAINEASNYINLGIYTRADYWINWLNNTNVFSYLPLWDANYDGNPTLLPVNYGGWTMPYAKQYQSPAYTLNGVDIDGDVFNDSVNG